MIRTALVLMLLGAVLLCSPPAALAEELPPEATERLAEILKGAEFQPRGTELGYSEQLTAWLAERIMPKLVELWDSLPWGSMKVDPDGPFMRFLKRLGAIVVSLVELFNGVLYYVPYLLCAGLIAYLLYRFIPRGGSAAAAEALTGGAPLPPEPSLEQLLAAERYDDLLAALRRRFRRDWRLKYALPESLTDREVRKALPRSEVRREQFERTARLFEARVFAGKPLDAGAVSTLCREFLRDQEAA